MQIATVPQDESARLDALSQYEVLDTPPEEAFDGLTRLASQICGPSIHQSDIVIVPDASNALGTLYGIDQTPKQLTPDQVDVLRILGQLVMNQLGLRRETLALERIGHNQKQREKSRARLLSAIDHSLEGMAVLSKDGCDTDMNPAHAALHEYTIDELIGQSWQMLHASDWADKTTRLSFPMLLAKGHRVGEVTGNTKSGREISMEISLSLLQDQSDPAQRFICIAEM